MSSAAGESSSSSKVPENSGSAAAAATGSEYLEQLANEAEELRKKLDAERHKLNDIPIQQAAERLDVMGALGVKQRRILKGHVGKVLCMDWSLDKRHIVSSSQSISHLTILSLPFMKTSCHLQKIIEIEGVY
ncbi:Protein CBG12105 [Caenorhabditis briggsae]|uniref:Protein CBG12105 n=1 Tax=Caenorhabditis briggsae TaxID=6238 RepID=A8XER9_CAEBR|nr:Protein CBG12105 [Caenorhabditis briggsae]CAP31141.2 Protein CBG12105 [Caenorhabditis briggsae]